MAGIFLCEVSAVHAGTGMLDVAVADRDGMVKTDVPMLDTVYEMPEAGEMVLVLFEEKGGTLQRGVVLGRPYSVANRPVQGGAQVFYKRFRDGASVKYDAAAKTMEVSAERLCVKHLTAEHIVYRTVCEKE